MRSFAFTVKVLTGLIQGFFLIMSNLGCCLRGNIIAVLAKQSRGGSTGSSSKNVCIFCGMKGHIDKYCFKPKNYDEGSVVNTKVHDEGDQHPFIRSHEPWNKDINDDYAMMASYASCN